MLRAEIAHLTCEQIARGGLLAVHVPGPFHEPKIEDIDARLRAIGTNDGNLETCRRAAQWLDEAGDRGAAMAVREHIRQQWGRFAASEAA